MSVRWYSTCNSVLLAPLPLAIVDYKLQASPSEA